MVTPEQRRIFIDTILSNLPAGCKDFIFDGDDTLWAHIIYPAYNMIPYFKESGVTAKMNNKTANSYANSSPENGTTVRKISGVNADGKLIIDGLDDVEAPENPLDPVLLKELFEALKERGVERIHLSTMNRLELAEGLLQANGLLQYFTTIAAINGSKDTETGAEITHENSAPLTTLDHAQGKTERAETGKNHKQVAIERLRDLGLISDVTTTAMLDDSLTEAKADDLKHVVTNITPQVYAAIKGVAEFSLDEIASIPGAQTELKDYEEVTDNELKKIVAEAILGASYDESAINEYHIGADMDTGSYRIIREDINSEKFICSSANVESCAQFNKASTISVEPDRDAATVGAPPEITEALAAALRTTLKYEGDTRFLNAGGKVGKRLDTQMDAMKTAYKNAKGEDATATNFNEMLVQLSKLAKDRKIKAQKITDSLKTYSWGGLRADKPHKDAVAALFTAASGRKVTEVEIKALNSKQQRRFTAALQKLDNDGVLQQTEIRKAQATVATKRSNANTTSETGLSRPSAPDPEKSAQKKRRNRAGIPNGIELDPNDSSRVQGFGNYATLSVTDQHGREQLWGPSHLNFHMRENRTEELQDSMLNYSTIEEFRGGVPSPQSVIYNPNALGQEIENNPSGKAMSAVYTQPTKKSQEQMEAPEIVDRPEPVMMEDIELPAVNRENKPEIEADSPPPVPDEPSAPSFPMSIQINVGGNDTKGEITQNGDNYILSYNSAGTDKAVRQFDITSDQFAQINKVASWTRARTGVRAYDSQGAMLFKAEQIDVERSQTPNFLTDEPEAPTITRANKPGTPPPVIRTNKPDRGALYQGQGLSRDFSSSDGSLDSTRSGALTIMLEKDGAAHEIETEVNFGRSTVSGYMPATATPEPNQQPSSSPAVEKTRGSAATPLPKVGYELNPESLKQNIKALLSDLDLAGGGEISVSNKGPGNDGYNAQCHPIADREVSDPNTTHVKVTIDFTDESGLPKPLNLYFGKEDGKVSMMKGGTLEEKSKKDIEGKISKLLATNTDQGKALKGEIAKRISDYAEKMTQERSNEIEL